MLFAASSSFVGLGPNCGVPLSEGSAQKGGGGVQDRWGLRCKCKARELGVCRAWWRRVVGGITFSLDLKGLEGSEP